MQIERPGDVEFTLKMTMPLSRWEDLANQLNKIGTGVLPYPSIELQRAVAQMTRKARAVLEFDTEAQEPRHYKEMAEQAEAALLQVYRTAGSRKKGLTANAKIKQIREIAGKAID